jgi:hypothetical protein
VLVVVASSRDRIAARTVAYWGADRARLLTCRDLSRSGWRYRPGAASRGTAVVGGQRVRVSDIEGVLVRLPFVPSEELPHIVPGDRNYVAQEMTAFLTAWLAELPCPVLNRPTAVCLGGPGWGLEQWRQVAAGLGLAVRPRRLRVVASADVDDTVEKIRSRMTVTVVGRRCFGSAPPYATDQARRLAAAAGTDLLGVHFATTRAGPRFVYADPWPDISPPAVADALRECLHG